MDIQHTRAVLIEARQLDEGPRRFRFRVSSGDVARDNMIIEPSAWRLDNFLRNPVVLASHNMFQFPIGRATEMTRDDEGLVAEIEFDGEDPTGRDAIRKLDGGFLNAVSVSWITHDMDRRSTPPRVTDAELLEISLVSIPSDTNALAMRSLLTRERTDVPETPPALLDVLADVRFAVRASRNDELDDRTRYAAMRAVIDLEDMLADDLMDDEDDDDRYRDYDPDDGYLEDKAEEESKLDLSRFTRLQEILDA